MAQQAYESFLIFVEKEKPKFLQHRPVVTRVAERLLDFVETYIMGMPGMVEEEEFGESSILSKA